MQNTRHKQAAEITVSQFFLSLSTINTLPPPQKCHFKQIIQVKLFEGCYSCLTNEQSFVIVTFVILHVKHNWNNLFY